VRSFPRSAIVEITCLADGRLQDRLKKHIAIARLGGHLAEFIHRLATPTGQHFAVVGHDQHAAAKARLQPPGLSMGLGGEWRLALVFTFLFRAQRTAGRSIAAQYRSQLLRRYDTSPHRELDKLR